MIRVVALGLALFVGLNGGGALAMTSDSSTMRCSVTGAGKLPAALNSDGICKTFRAALEPALQVGAEASVRVSVESSSKLAATATVGGKALPEHHVATADRPLNARAVAMLARAVAADIAALRR